MAQTDAVFLCFLDVLKQTGQRHIYDELVEGGYKGLTWQRKFNLIARSEAVVMMYGLGLFGACKKRSY